MKFQKGQKVKIDGEIKGTVDGWYKGSVVVELGYMRGVKGKFVGSGGKETFLSTILVHPSNLTPA